MEKVILIIRDGWGYRKDKENNAIANSKTPFTNYLMKNFPTTLLDASNGAVGLPTKYQGNSEVGHLTLGSGRIIEESLVRINKSIKDKSFFKNKEFLNSINYAKKNKSSLHLIGLMQTEGVHAHLNHLFALLDLCKQKKFKNVKIHVITDGRDSPPKNSLKNLKLLENKIKEIGFGEIVTISGRYYAMDRDKRWNRTKKAYDCIMNSKTKFKFETPEWEIKENHNHKITDEFIFPSAKESYNGIKKKDSIIFYNFRTDRMRQLIKAIVKKEFSPWQRKKRNLYVVAMTEYYKPMNANIAFKDIKIPNLLGEIISEADKSQLRISETEKYAHVTFFFNGQIEKANKKEDRILIPSPKVATYDLKPEMKANQIANELVKNIKKKKYDFIVTNLVNCDMVGHTGITPAIKKATAAVDEALEKITLTGLRNNYTVLIVADHGNAEDQRPKWITSHTINPVPCILVSSNKELNKIKLEKGKGLKDIAPTILQLMEIPKPKEMTGKSIIKINKNKYLIQLIIT
ncbi:2,3-bisphosphoglycerate-independent phosphoglycerate mutase [archaeon]|jgi:2,3-bisphosphoglycerate-independent phosphoglycerate mutase|nr:2,3-bisphosphoglycerate-independent phosphoglycerate mutase [archaeon]